ncbi:MAG: bifunctional phosphoglucose/phosphomannose isomerase [Chloroflexi bacterium]|nr:bifunctional phosphoglucose/phosphomannose isomerase [Chloroflexota bacterium]
MTDLDSPESFAALDREGMLRSIADLPQQCEDAWSKARLVHLPPDYCRAQNAVIVGVGGSGIGGDLLRGLCVQECSIPLLVHRDYLVPAFVNEDSLVIICSYSGNTEEALVGFESAWRKGARLVCITTGGKLERRAEECGAYLCLYHYAAQPRAALGYALMFLLGVAQHVGWITDKSADVAEAVAVMKHWQSEIKETVPTAENAAKKLAQSLYGHVPVVYGAEHLGEVARRWKGQFNENAKSWAKFDVLPELNHNSVVGYPLPHGWSDLARVVLLTSTLNHPRVNLRFEITRELLQRYGFAHETIQARGNSALAHVLSMVHFGDYVSYYLAMLYGVDPWAIGNIEYVKMRLEQA